MTTPRNTWQPKFCFLSRCRQALVVVVSGDRGGGGGSGGRDPHLSERLQQGWRCTMLLSCLFSRFYYFGPLVVAYAIGLGRANFAVYVIMKMGQPALLYLVPCCLGTMIRLGSWHRHELRQLWEGPKVLETAGQIVFFGTPQLPPQDMGTSSTTISKNITATGGTTIQGGGTSDEDSNVDLGNSNQKSMTGNFHHDVADDEIENGDDETAIHLPLLNRRPEMVNCDIAA